ncbi:MAG: SPOR domain-containing protein [Magnetococcales bacterium]|nr:SPOR domain-containing protein [Magnetococcales bacterium]
MSQALSAITSRFSSSGGSSALSRFGPLAFVSLMALLNLHLLWITLTKTESGLWTGPLMMGKVLPLQPKSAGQAKTEARPEAKPESKEHSAKPEVPPVKEKAAEKPKTPAATLQAVSKPVGRAEPKPSPTHTPPAAVAESASVGSQAPDGKGYYVQAGSFALRKGADTLIARLRTKGLNPRLLQQTDMVLVNNVQAGPFRIFGDAKEAEIKLRSAGIIVKTDNTWEGYMISISKEIHLGNAIDSMANAEKLGVKPLRIIKVEDAQKFFKVILGPYKSEKDAKETSANLAASGLAVPLIKKWDASEEAAQKDVEG